MGDFAAILEKPYILNNEELGSARAGGLGVFAGSHREEEGADSQFTDGLVPFSGSDTDKSPKDLGSKCLLRLLRGV